ncbi:MAG: ABC transporter permease, partial [Gammaproteobacteria bacterium]
MSAEGARTPARSWPGVAVVEQIGRAATRGVEGLGYGAALLAQSVRWIVLGHLSRQPVRISSIATEIMEIGVRALPIVTVLSMTIGVMLAIQGIHTLRTFGAEAQVTLGIALSVT